MPSVDIKLGTALVNTYDGSPAQLNAFIDAVTLFADTVEAEFEAATAAQKVTAQNTVVRFIKTRLTGVARQAIGELNELQQILNAIKLRCASKATSDAILAKLKITKQNSTSEQFCDAVEKLTNDLRSTYLTEGIPPDTAEKMATKRGVETLINGIKNQDTKLILKAGNFEKINDAVQKLQENDSSESLQQKHIFHATQRGHGRHRYQRGQSGRGYGPRGRNTYNNSGRYNNNRNFNQYNNNGYRTGNNNNWRGRGNQQSYYRNQGAGQQIYYANQNQGNVQIPQQQQQIGGILPNQQIQQQNQPVRLAQIVQRQ